MVAVDRKEYKSLTRFIDLDMRFGTHKTWYMTMTTKAWLLSRMQILTTKLKVK